jgi:methyl-accepting chemotaxis protein
MTIGARTALGFGATLALLSLVVILSVWGIGRMTGDAREVIDQNKLKASLAQREIDHLNWAQQVARLFTDQKVTRLNVQTDHHRCAFGQWYYSDARKQTEAYHPELAGLLADIEQPHRELHASAVAIGKHFRQVDPDLGEFLRARQGDHLRWLKTLREALIDESVSTAELQTDPDLCALGEWLASPAARDLARDSDAVAQLLDQMDAPHRRLHEGALRINQLLAEGKRAQATAYYASHIAPTAEGLLARLDELIAWQNQRAAAVAHAKAIYETKTRPALEEVQSTLGELCEHVDHKVAGTNRSMVAAAGRTRVMVLGIGIAAVVLGLIMAWGIARSITGVLKRIIAGLDDGSEQTASAAAEVASAGQSLADNSSKQAAAVEETSASIEEIASMVKNNAGNARQAKDMVVANTASTKEAKSLAESALDLAKDGNSSMDRMSDAINKIKGSAEETAKIVKTIDEIAFQTNLLALNAAVEAARAGDAGKGFAVVAEEVRNLAQRSASAAKDTADLIKESVSNSERGVTVSSEVLDAFENISDTVQKVAVHIGEVAAASDEQTQLIESVSNASEEQATGIEQINEGVAQIDDATQANAGAAQQSAAAAEQLGGQAEELRAMVGQLRALVTRRGTSAAPAYSTEPAVPSGGPRRDASPPPAENIASSPSASDKAALSEF